MKAARPPTPTTATRVPSNACARIHICTHTHVHTHAHTHTHTYTHSHIHLQEGKACESSTSANPYYGYKGAFQCMHDKQEEGKTAVAFVKHTTFDDYKDDEGTSWGSKVSVCVGVCMCLSVCVYVCVGGGGGCGCVWM